MHFLLFVALVCVSVYSQTEECVSCIRQKKQFGITLDNKIVCESKETFDIKFMIFVAFSVRTCARITTRADSKPVSTSTSVPESTTDRALMPTALPITEQPTAKPTDKFYLLRNSTTFSAILSLDARPAVPTLTTDFPQDRNNFTAVVVDKSDNANYSTLIENASNSTDANTDYGFETSGSPWPPTLQIVPVNVTFERESSFNRVVRSMCRAYGLIDRYWRKNRNMESIITKRVASWNRRSVMKDHTELCKSLVFARKLRPRGITVNE